MDRIDGSKFRAVANGNSIRDRGALRRYLNGMEQADAEHALIVTHAVTLDAADHRCLIPMAKAASQALGQPATLNVVADTGYLNGAHATRCEEIGIITHVPA